MIQTPISDHFPYEAWANFTLLGLEILSVGEKVMVGGMSLKEV